MASTHGQRLGWVGTRPEPTVGPPGSAQYGRLLRVEDWLGRCGAGAAGRGNTEVTAQP